MRYNHLTNQGDIMSEKELYALAKEDIQFIDAMSYDEVRNLWHYTNKLLMQCNWRPSAQLANINSKAEFVYEGMSLGG
jgi:hypothetical protein